MEAKTTAKKTKIITEKTKIAAFILSIIVLFSISIESVFADDDDDVGYSDDAIIQEENFAIGNISYNHPVIINIGPNPTSLADATILPRRSIEFSCVNQKFVRIITNNSGEVSYKVDCAKGSRYFVKWDEGRKLWNLYLNG